MSICLDTLAREIARHGPIVRVLIAAHRGSTPREAGTEMLVWADGQSGTIGGGALEYAALAQARAMLADGTPIDVRQMALGASLGQCCGGHVTLISERLHAGAPVALEHHVLGGVLVRPMRADAGPRPSFFGQTGFAYQDGWLHEPMRGPGTPVWIYGAGHVGRAMAHMLAPLPEWHATLVDTSPKRLANLPESAVGLPASDPASVVNWAPSDARHFVMTYSHDMDLAVCHALLQRDFAFAGLIGSATKWARFQKRLKSMGRDDCHRITCPIGDPALGKHPQAIAIGAVSQLLSQTALNDQTAAAAE